VILGMIVNLCKVVPINTTFGQFYEKSKFAEVNGLQFSMM